MKCSIYWRLCVCFGIVQRRCARVAVFRRRCSKWCSGWATATVWWTRSSTRAPAANSNTPSCVFFAVDVNTTRTTTTAAVATWCLVHLLPLVSHPAVPPTATSLHRLPPFPSAISLRADAPASLQTASRCIPPSNLLWQPLGRRAECIDWLRPVMNFIQLPPMMKLLWQRRVIVKLTKVSKWTVWRHQREMILVATSVELATDSRRRQSRRVARTKRGKIRLAVDWIKWSLERLRQVARHTHRWQWMLNRPWIVKRQRCQTAGNAVSITEPRCRFHLRLQSVLTRRPWNRTRASVCKIVEWSGVKGCIGCCPKPPSSSPAVRKYECWPLSWIGNCSILSTLICYRRNVDSRVIVDQWIDQWVVAGAR